MVDKASHHGGLTSLLYSFLTAPIVRNGGTAFHLKDGAKAFPLFFVCRDCWYAIEPSPTQVKQKEKPLQNSCKSLDTLIEVA